MNVSDTDVDQAALAAETRERKSSATGITAYPPPRRRLDHGSSGERVSLGSSDLNALMGGGIYRGSSILVSGPTGSGKTLFGMHFAEDAVQNGENCLFISFEESKEELKHVINVVKVRGSGHSKGLHLYDIMDTGVVIGQSLRGYVGVLTGRTEQASLTMAEGVRTAFERFLGPMTGQVFDELKEEGLTMTNIDGKIQELEEGDVLSSEEADTLRRTIDEVYTGRSIPARDASASS